MVSLDFLNLQTGDDKVPGYLDAEQVLSWTAWKIEELQPGMHRSLRGKTLVTITTKAGSMNWTAESFHRVSAKLLRPLGHAELAAAHEKEAELETAAALHSKFAV